MHIGIYIIRYTRVATTLHTFMYTSLYNMYILYIIYERCNRRKLYSRTAAAVMADIVQLL